MAPVATYESIASSKFYSSPTYMEVPGALVHYDLPDLAAAAIAANRSKTLLVFSPTDALLAPLTGTAATRPYAFAQATAARRSGASVRIVAGCARAVLPLPQSASLPSTASGAPHQQPLAASRRPSVPGNRSDAPGRTGGRGHNGRAQREQSAL